MAIQYLPMLSVVLHQLIFQTQLQNRANTLQHHLDEVVPEEYQRCMTGMKHNLKQTLEIAESTEDPKVKLQARAIANDCYRFIMDMSTNASIVSDALKFVNQSEKKINNMHKQRGNRDRRNNHYKRCLLTD